MELRAFLLIIIFVFIYNCSGKPSAPVEKKAEQKSKTISEQQDRSDKFLTKDKSWILGKKLNRLICRDKNYSSEELRKLVKQGADVNFVTNIPTLHCAARLCRLEDLSYLISKGANVNARSTYHPRETALFSYNVEKCKNYSDIIKLFISNGAKIDRYLMEESILLSESQKELIRKHAEEDKNETLLMLCEYGDSEDNFPKIKRLVEEGADVNYQSKESGGTTALMTAGHYCNKKTIEFLVSKGAKINLQNRNGETIFFHLEGTANAGSDECSREVERFLILRGGDVNIRNKTGRKAPRQAPTHTEH